jgi:hypothetical protein
MRDLMNNIDVKRAISPVSVADNTAQVSQIIDRRGFDSLTFVIALGSLADADATFTVLVEHDDAAGFGTATAVPASELVGTTTLASFQFDDDNKCRKIGYLGNKRYVRMTITPANNSSAALIAAVAILGHAAQQPQSNPPA